ncbi:ABC transporter permease subunit [Roseovarius spongiae]|uniref:ABC transporter permease subunit n=1 Tax=Roseovarius spongiae TaxID=2320272 RepID=A0A3A8AZV9_9RHOB|nr:ABC transporter permease subunit [Roseovarius spongiae]RKF16610.1 ABC transporter permease subunit [Roseovarius spongiae]
MIRLWNNLKLRNTALQVAYVGGFVALVLGMALVARANLDELGIISGFDFLFKSTGWKVSFSLIEFTASDPYWRVLLVGFLNTLFLAAIGLVLATVIGVIVGMARTSSNDLARLLGAIYVETFRNVPLILQVFFWYAVFTRFPGPRQAISLADGMFLSSRGIYVPGLNITGLSAFLGIVVFLAGLGVIVWITAAQRFRRMEPARKTRLRLLILAAAALLMAAIFWLGRLPDTPLVSIPALKGLNYRGGVRVSTELTALAVSIAIYGGSYIAEIVRGGFKAVGRGQIEAAQSVGLSAWQVFSRVRFPLALRAMMPILTNQYIWLVKATTMGIAIGFADFFMVVSISINQSGQTLELIGILMAGFLLINFTLAAVLNRINRAIALKGDQLRS